MNEPRSTDATTPASRQSRDAGSGTRPRKADITLPSAEGYGGIPADLLTIEGLRAVLDVIWPADRPALTDAELEREEIRDEVEAAFSPAPENTP